jgi:hypothetical protein
MKTLDFKEEDAWIFSDSKLKNISPESTGGYQIKSRLPLYQRDLLPRKAGTPKIDQTIDAN